MNIPTSHQLIQHQGQPVAVVVPYSDYVRAFPQESPTIPHAVVMRSIDVSLVRAWREHLGLSQSEVAARMGISQPAYQKLEDKSARPRLSTLQKIAAALNLDIRQIHP